MSIMMSCYVLIAKSNCFLTEVKLGTRTIPKISVGEKYIPENLEFVVEEVKKCTGIECFVVRKVSNTRHLCYLLEDRDNTSPKAGFNYSSLEILRYEGDDIACELVSDYSSAKIELYSPWERLGWYTSLLKQLQPLLNENSWGDVISAIQLKGAWPNSCVLLLTTQFREFVYKRSQRRHPIEGEVLQVLKESTWRNYVPNVIHSEVDFFLMERVPEPRANPYLSDIEKTVELFSMLQKKSVDSLLCFNEVPVLDCSGIVTEALKVADYFDNIVREFPIIREFRNSILTERFPVVERHFPQLVFVNEDFRMENVVINGNKIVFLDWTDCAVTLPFIALENFLYEARKTARTELNESDIRHVYYRLWVDPTDDMDFEELFAESYSLFLLSRISRHFKMGFLIREHLPTPPTVMIQDYLSNIPRRDRLSRGA
jgi:hypothetical protein